MDDDFFLLSLPRHCNFLHIILFFQHFFQIEEIIATEGSQHSISGLAKRLNASRTTVHRIITQDLELKSLRRTKRHEIRDPDKRHQVYLQHIYTNFEQWRDMHAWAIFSGCGNFFNRKYHAFRLQPVIKYGLVLLKLFAYIFNAKAQDEIDMVSTFFIIRTVLFLTECHEGRGMDGHQFWEGYDFQRWKILHCGRASG